LTPLARHGGGSRLVSVVDRERGGYNCLPLGQPRFFEERYRLPRALSDGSAHAFHAIPALAALNATQERDSKGEGENSDSQINHVVSSVCIWGGFVPAPARTAVAVGSRPHVRLIYYAESNSPFAFVVYAPSA
jgi:hypothetical protein